MLIVMTEIIHFHAPLHINIGDAAVVCSIRDMLSRFLRTSSYTSLDFERLKGVGPNLQALTRLRSAKTINMYDLCIVGGGGLYSKWFFPLNNELIKSIKIPIVLYGIGQNVDYGDDELSRVQKNSIFLLNRQAELSSVRDSGTLKLLGSLGLDNIDLIGDPAVFLEMKKARNVERRNMRVGINIAHHRWKLQSECLERVLCAYIHTCRFLIRTYGAQIVYLKHTPSENKIIRILARYLPLEIADCCSTYNLAYKLKLRLPLLPIKIGMGNPYRLKYIYSSLDLVIGMHLHSAILAFGTGVPVLSISYNLKNYAFMKSIHQEDMLVRADRIDPRRLEKMTMTILDNASEVASDFRRLKGRMWRHQELFLKKIKSL